MLSLPKIYNTDVSYAFRMDSSFPVMTMQSMVLDRRISGRAYSCESPVEGCWRSSLLTTHPRTEKPFIAAAESKNRAKAPSPSSCPRPEQSHPP